MNHPIYRIMPETPRSRDALLSHLHLGCINVPAVIAAGPTKRDREIACSQAHANCLRQFFDSGAEFCAVLEDDAILADDHEWLSYTAFDLFVPFSSSREMLAPDKTILPSLPKSGTQAYVASRLFAARYIRLLEAGHVADAANHIAARGLRIGRYKGNLVNHDHRVPSLICEGRRQWWNARIGQL